MKISRIALLGLFVSGTVLAQDNLLPRFDDYYRRLQPSRLDDVGVSSQLPWNAGEHVRTEFSLAFTDDIAQNIFGQDANSDNGLDTWGYLLRIRERRQRGDLTFDLLGRLSMDKQFDPVDPTKHRNKFVEIVDAGATWRSIPEPNGIGFELSAGARYIGNVYSGNFLSPAAQANKAHSDWNFGDPPNFQSGDVESWCAKAGGAFTWQHESEHRDWFCTFRVRGEVVAPVDNINSNGWQQSNIGADARVGFPLIWGSSETPILTLEPHLSTTQLMREGGENRETLVGGDLIFRYRLLGLNLTNWINVDKPIERFRVLPVDDEELDLFPNHNLLIRIGGSFTF